MIVVPVCTYVATQAFLHVSVMYAAVFLTPLPSRSRFHGHGVLHFSNGGTFEADWESGRAIGQGTGVRGPALGCIIPTHMYRLVDKGSGKLRTLDKVSYAYIMWSHVKRETLPVYMYVLCRWPLNVTVHMFLGVFSPEVQELTAFNTGSLGLTLHAYVRTYVQCHVL